MKLAIIDIGSNSVRLLLATYENNIWHYEPKQLWTTRLGQRNSDGTLRTESMEASYQAFTEIKKTSRPIWGGMLLWFCNERCS